MRLAVHPGWRKKGIGRALVNTTFSKLLTRHVDGLVVTIPASHVLLNEFFRTCGMRCLRFQKQKQYCVLGMQADSVTGP